MSNQLYQAVRNGDLSRVRQAMNSGIGPDARNLQNNNPLITSITYEHTNIAKELIKRGANINVRDRYTHQTPLFTAAVLCNVDILRLLIRKGADVNARDSGGANALLYAIANSNSSGNITEVVRLLIRAGANVNVRINEENTTALMWAVDLDMVNIVRMLIAAGANVNERNKEGKSIVGIAKNPTIIRLLVWAGAKVNKNTFDNANVKKRTIIINTLGQRSRARSTVRKITNKVRWARGLENEKKRAMKNFEEFQKNFRKMSPVRSPPKKIQSPVKPKSPNRFREERNRLAANRIRLGIAGKPKPPGPPLNNRITWFRTPSGQISITRTIENLHLKLPNAIKNRILSMPENQAKQVLRGLASMPYI